MRTGEKVPIENLNSNLPLSRRTATGSDSNETSHPLPVPSAPNSHAQMGKTNQTSMKYLMTKEYHQVWHKWANEAVKEGEKRQEALLKMKNCLEKNDAVLWLSDLKLSSLPNLLPPSIKTLNLFYNKLTSLPDNLPVSLTILDVSDNQLIALPDNLPVSLTTLWVFNNQLTSLPDNLPASLTTLDVSDNELTVLPDNLPVSLIILWVFDNQLTSLPVSITRLPQSGHVFLGGNPLSERTLQALWNINTDLTYQGPQIFARRK